MRDYERRNANRKSVLAAIEQKLRLTGPWSQRPGRGLPSWDRCRSPPPCARPAATSSTSRSTRSPTAATASRAATATSCSSPAALPGDKVRARRRQEQARLRRGARGRGARALAGPRAAARRPPGRAVAGAALRAPARGQGRAGRRGAAAASAASRASSSSRSCPAVEQWRYRNKLEYSFGTGGDGELVCGFHAPGRFDEIVADRPTACSPPSAATQRASRCSPCCRAQGLTAWDRRDAGGLPAQPRRPRGAAHRPAAGPPGHLAGQAAGRRADRRRRLRRAAVDADRGPRREHRRAARRRCSAGAPSCSRSSAGCGSRSRPTRSSRPTPRWPSSSTRVAAEFAGLRGHERVFDLYCGIGTIGAGARRPRARGRRRRDRRVGGRRRDRQRPRQRGRQRVLLRRRHPPGDARARRAGRASPTCA